MSNITGLEITLKAIENAHRKGLLEFYFWTVSGEADFIKSIEESPYVKKVIYDNRLQETSRHTMEANALRALLETHYCVPGQGYVAILS